MAKQTDFETFNDFWPYYLSEHTHPTTRLMHVVGTAMSLAFVILLTWSGDLQFLAAAIIVGYGFAWFSHIFVERNRPATFRYPIWSLMGDFRMFALACTGRLDAELKHQARKQRLGK
jgi:hypothetical protein